MKSRTKWLTVIAALGFLMAGPSAPARESRQHPDEDKAKALADADAANMALWKSQEPEIEAWAAKGKPYIPWACHAGDLPQAGIPAFPGAQGGGEYSFGGRGGKVFVV